MLCITSNNKKPSPPPTLWQVLMGSKYIIVLMDYMNYISHETSAFNIFVFEIQCYIIWNCYALYQKPCSQALLPPCGRCWWSASKVLLRVLSSWNSASSSKDRHRMTFGFNFISIVNWFPGYEMKSTSSLTYLSYTIIHFIFQIHSFRIW